MLMQPKVAIVYALYVLLYVMLLWDNIESKVNLVYYWNVIIHICTSVWVVNICRYVSCHPSCQYCRYRLVWMVYLELVYLIWLQLYYLS